MTSKMNKPTIALAAGGTGGHMFPASSLAHELIARGFDILLLTDKRGMAYSHIFKGMNVKCIESKSPMQGGIGKRISAIWDFFKGAYQTAMVMRKHNVKAVVGFGGYASLSTLLGARAMRLPYGLHEQNAVLGRVNKLMLSGCVFLATSFEVTKSIKDSALEKLTLTGNPTRASISKIGETKYKLPKKADMFHVLAVGGSLGSRIFADIIPAALTFLDSGFKARLMVTQQCRSEDISRVEKAYKRSNINCKITPFIDDMAYELEKAHLVISRAGAGSVTEVALASRPAIFVPLAIAADNHQTFNAQALSLNKAGWMLTENEFSPSRLAALIKNLVTNSAQLVEAARNAKALAKSNATLDLANLVEEKLLNLTLENKGVA